MKYSYVDRLSKTQILINNISCYTLFNLKTLPTDFGSIVIESKRVTKILDHHQKLAMLTIIFGVWTFVWTKNKLFSVDVILDLEIWMFLKTKPLIKK